MANRNDSKVPGAHVRFGELNFIAMAEGELARAPAAAQPLYSIGLSAIAEALEELLLHAPVVRTAGSDQLLNFDYEKLELQLSTFLGPQPSWEDLCHLTFSLTNIITWLARGEPLSLEYLIWSTPTTLPCE